MIKVIDINELNEGDVLAEPIHNALGHILLPANAVISANSLKLLKTLNITNITIKKIDENSQNEGLTDEEVESTLNIMVEKIGWSPDNEFEEELLKMAAIHKLKGKSIK
ncbi:MAG: hypothetical protein N2319_05580 [Candidatus Kapabacteria bacterium]|nr:hypothetical protein [Candidatus Kapabacteria bacterium]